MTMLRQNHIHLGTTASETGEKAPVWKWVVSNQGYIESTYLVQDIRRTLTGKLRKYRMRNQGSILRLNDVKLTLFISERYGRTTDEQLADLRSMVGAEVLYVPIQHCADGEDHSSYVRNMYFANMAEPQAMDPALMYYQVTIELMDNTI